ncbi:NYN domain-containing protein [filamentous cyanobacterium LEGE 11480]|uniref:NYN domain-containing protein n=1 Tax=Romeriopsis navalis LEGE 11480 TaxID=2777977 RepID=A0A928Z2N6_9CYAN|nr:NYN domain-containing protein [Romeriopsis navalis]MBE9030571.1 NYN domain-containing protein [Romeriopsis navalis LEGE 11480]
MSDRGFPTEQPDDGDRVILLIDGESLFQAAAQLQFEIDYAKLLDYFAQKHQLVRAYFYTGISAGNHRQQAFLKWMQRNGYRVISKDLIVHKDGRRSADLSVEIATDLLRLADQVHSFIIITHNDDLTYAIAMASQRGVRVELVGLPEHIRSSLSNACDNTINISKIKSLVQKTVR